jgi:beta-glucosidase
VPLSRRLTLALLAASGASALCNGALRGAARAAPKQSPAPPAALPQTPQATPRPQPARAAQPPPRFPERFVWGSATAALQVEGAANSDGRAPSIWDMFCRKPGKVWRDQCPDVSADHYHRVAEDVALMQELGLQAYRFSVSWSRVLPEGTGAINRKGLDFYDRLVDRLLAAKVAPWLTLYHWDLPLALYRRGGFLNREVADWFADYTKLLVERLGDRVAVWMPLNEPQVFVGSGLQGSRHAPGDQLSFSEVMLAAHHALLCHGRAVPILRSARNKAALVGTSQAGVSSVPATNRAEDIAAARARALGSAPETMYSNALWLDAMVFGRYPEDYLRGNAKHLPARFETSALGDDLRTIGQRLDFIGLNQYQCDRVRRGKDGQPEVVPFPDGVATTTMEWAVEPSTMYWMPKWLHERYRLPLYITENGVAVSDWLSLDGKCHDPLRIDFTTRFLRELARAIADGVPVHGYLYWSLLDNYEWAHGYKQRFGLVHVDYESGKRTKKDSALWYRDVIASNGRSLWP